MSNFITFSQICQKYNKTGSQVRYAIQQGRLKAIKIGWQWFFDKNELPKTWPESPRTTKRMKRGKTIG